MEDFEYVVRKQEKQKICFGSGRERDTSRKGMSPFMKHYTLDNYPNVAPNSYNVMDAFNAVTTRPCSRSISRKGYSGIARYGVNVDHGEDYPSPFDYNIMTFPKGVTEQKHAFGATSERKAFLTNNNPGPGMYVSTGKRSMKFEHSFGGRVKMCLGVELKCCSRNADVCKACGQKPIGDYWHYNDKLFLCRTCMSNQIGKKRTYNKIDLKHFRKIRDCSYIHSHEGTNAKVWLVHPKDAIQWMRKEAYLSAYLQD